MRHNGTEQGRRSPRVMRMRPNTPTRPASGRTTVRGITATRTRKATRNRRDKNRVHHLTTEEMRDVVYRMTLEWVAQADIAQALNITQGRVSQLLNDETKLRTEQWQLTADQWRQREIERTDTFISKWAPRALLDEKAGSLLLSWCERKDKLLGLYSNRIELSGPGGRPVQIESEDDLSLLDEAELQQLERLKAKMQRLPAPPEPE